MRSIKEWVWRWMNQKAYMQGYAKGRMHGFREGRFACLHLFEEAMLARNVHPALKLEIEHTVMDLADTKD